MKILFIVNVPEFFLSHRLPLALAARKAGYFVQIATGEGPACEQIRGLGFVHHPLPLSRSGTNPWLELNCLWALWRLIRRLKPDLLHLVTIKPVLYGGLMARLARVPAVLVAISGLGSVFVASGVVSWLRPVVQMLYRFALRHPNLKAIFQNPDDNALLTRFGVVREEQTVLIRGSGVTLADYPVKPEPAGIPVVTFAARLLKEKGVLEFVEAARVLIGRGLASRFFLVGAPDPGNPSSVSDKEIEHWQASGLIEPLGYRNDIADVFANSNLVVLPSYYGEGLPKVLIEAASTGRAVITTNHPGCRDAIEPNVTGLLVPPRDALALADAIECLLSNSALRQSMGSAGRRLAEQQYGIDKVIAAHLQIYQELIESCEPR